MLFSSGLGDAERAQSSWNLRCKRGYAEKVRKNQAICQNFLRFQRFLDKVQWLHWKLLCFSRGFFHPPPAIYYILVFTHNRGPKPAPRCSGEFIPKVSHQLDPFPWKDPEVKEILLLSLTCQPSYSSRRQSWVAFTLISFSRSSLQRLKPKKTSDSRMFLFIFAVFKDNIRTPFLFVLEVGPVTCIVMRDSLYIPGIQPPQLPFGVKKKKLETR